jgi:hypothetical protein
MCPKENMTAENQPPCTGRRIYVGGIDPLRGLTVDDVLRRVQGRVEQQHEQQPKQATISMSDLHLGKCYFQFTASCDEQDPLQQLKSWFHNVTWKGCKLVVEEARPHFLERLKEEQAAKRKEEARVPVLVFMDTVTRRYWKVRRGYGELRLVVDTQPCAVKDWEMQARIRQRHLTQQNKENDNERDNLRIAQKRSYYNRSIHLRFEDDKSGVAPLEASNDVSSASSSSISSNASENLAPSDKRYKWSDDDEDESAASAKLSKANTRLTNGSEVEERNSESDYMNDMEQPPTIVTKEATYIWSDNDDAGSDSLASLTRKDRPQLLSAQRNDFDEFAAAFNGTTPSHSETAAVQVGGAFADDLTALAADDFQVDVEQNLRVLSQLFPDMPPAKPAKLNAEKGDGTEKTVDVRSGWGHAGQMLRFDPTNREIACQYILHDDPNLGPEDSTAPTPSNDRESSNEESCERSYSDDSKASKDATVDNENANQSPDILPIEANIYEQGKLEQVFKDVRESSQQRVPIDKNSPFGTMGFAFGFDLHNERDVVSEAASTSQFNFSFSVAEGEPSTKKVNQKGDKEDSSYYSELSLDDTKLESSAPQKQYKAFVFPTESQLDMYVSQFYSVNDGDRIMDDLEGWRNDSAVKEKWLNERHALTQDWKRKHKLALSKRKPLR